MMVDVNLDVTAGLPYARRIRVKDGTNVWPSLDDLEVKSDVRVGLSDSSSLKSSLAPFITASIDGADIILDLTMTGNDTRTIRGGYYDIVVSDKGTTDARAIRVLKGVVQIDKLVTGG